MPLQWMVGFYNYLLPSYFSNTMDQLTLGGVVVFHKYWMKTLPGLLFVCNEISFICVGKMMNGRILFFLNLKKNNSPPDLKKTNMKLTEDQPS